MKTSAQEKKKENFLPRILLNHDGYTSNACNLDRYNYFKANDALWPTLTHSDPLWRTLTLDEDLQKKTLTYNCTSSAELRESAIYGHMTNQSSVGRSEKFCVRALFHKSRQLNLTLSKTVGKKI